MKPGVRILVVDDHELVRRGLRYVVSSREGWEVCGEASDGRTALKLARKLRPDVIVMDLAMPEMNGLESTRQIVKELPGTEVLILTMYDSEQLMHEVLKAGARGFVLKSDGAGSIAEAIYHLRRHKPFFTSRAADVMLKSYLEPDATAAGRTATPESLTPREREVVQLIAEGKSSKEVAGTLGISVKTAETHRANLMRKLDVHSVSEIVRYAIRNRMVEP